MGNQQRVRTPYVRKCMELLFLLLFLSGTGFEVVRVRVRRKRGDRVDCNMGAGGPSGGRLMCCFSTH